MSIGFKRLNVILLAGASLVPAMAWAQDAGAPPPVVADHDGTTAADEGKGTPGDATIVVTGSNVIRNGNQAPTPVTVMSTGELLDSAPARLGDALTVLPQFRGSPSPRTTYQATLGVGGSNLSLRGLGSFRTLVLVDGRRWVPNTTRGDFDTDMIPQSLVSRVDVVTGGASAQYGSDAVGGVVNFILDTKFSGLKGGVQRGISTYGDGGTFKAELSGGLQFGDGRGYVIASVSRSRFSEINSQLSRPWAASLPGLMTIGTAPFQVFYDNVGQPASYGGAITTGPLAGLKFLPDGVLAPYNLGNPRSASATVGSDGTHMVQPITSALNSTITYIRAGYEFSDAFKPFVEFSAAHNRSKFDQGYPNFQLGSTAYTIYSGNPFLPDSLQQRMTDQGIASFQLQRVSQDFGVTRADLDNKTINAQIGFDGQAGGWSFGAYGGYGENIGDYRILNNLDVQRLYAAADAVDDGTGRAVCRVTVTNPGLFPGCVSVNLFGDGAPSAEAMSYIKRDLPYSPRIYQYTAHAFLRGEPLSTWAGPVAIALGADYRNQRLRQTTDPLSSEFLTVTAIRGFPAPLNNRNGGFTTLNPQAAAGSVEVWEGSGEILVPLAKDVSWARSLDLNGAVRYTNYSTSGSVTTWKVGMTYAPVSDIRFRATYSRDIRAPSLGELYVVGLSAATGINDPQRGGRSYIVLSRGFPNPTLAPEIGKTYSVGAVLTPSFLRGFSASIDYYNIKIGGVISTLTTQQTIDACQGGSAFNCSLITRDPATTDIITISQPSQNLSSLRTSGIDVDLSYTTRVGEGTLRLRGVANYTPTYTTQVPGNPAINYAGEIGVRATGSLNMSNPKFTASLSLAYENNGFGLTLQERFIGRGTYDVTKVEGQTISDNSIPAVAYTDLTVRQSIDGFGSEQELFLTVNNLLNKAPPLFPNGSPILPSLYNRTLHDGIGRFFTAGVRFKF